MELGAFSVSLAVKDIGESKAFYEKLGFEPFMGSVEENWLMLRNGNTVLGLFQGMFTKNLLTFNPGWNQQAEALNDFKDIRVLQAELKEKGIPLLLEVNDITMGPGSLMIEDPDGNQILLDQHV